MEACCSLTARQRAQRLRAVEGSRTRPVYRLTTARSPTVERDKSAGLSSLTCPFGSRRIMRPEGASSPRHSPTALRNLFASSLYAAWHQHDTGPSAA
jgi:hypothetical protein